MGAWIELRLPKPKTIKRINQVESKFGKSQAKNIGKDKPDVYIAPIPINMEDYAYPKTSQAKN